MTLSIITLALILGAFFGLDLFFLRKKDGSFVRSLIYLVTVSVPALYKGAKSDSQVTEGSFSEIWFNYFYPVWGGAVFATFICIYFFSYLPLKRRYENYNQFKVVSFLGFLYSGFQSFKSELEKNKADQEKIDKSFKKDYLGIISEMDGDIKTFFHQMYSTLGSRTDSSAYATYFVQHFINTFFGTSSARFTFRKLNSSNGTMESVITTSTTTPAPIPLNKRNLISFSQKETKPIIFSRNKTQHYKTPVNSHGNSKYHDYVSYCLLETNDGKPYVSLSLDVKGETAVRKMHAFVDSGIYKIICEVLAIKILKENGQI